MASNHSATEESTKRHKVEGPKKHVIAFIFSLALTLIAFAAVMGGEINKDFIYIILMGTAFLQVFVQMAFWMHMKDRGHTFALIGILGGVFIVFTCVIMAEYWAWW
ncbi:cytochrome C oxidase subunit IV family protein [Paenibacillus harenae]|uniref:Cytochrome c oxidase subunit 4 n=1 Tax=Paenibacillus harenae TaxID=306543 RepID=A0ABT9TY37_PAEHA|nr:cytochrome C oxidase subunit IV family protein [Paenibacillus harenae]MDQ0060184.1 cytochrome c oxidase subunit 4 [Paenibacillus harenae]MDQ0112267.1 cytochrome c oxidase subunit 4 [Paenibacillus harenae]